MRFNRAWPFRASRPRRRRAVLGVALFGALAVTGAGLAPAMAEQLNPIPQPTGKTWNGSIYNATPYFPYVQVFDVRDPAKEADLNDPKLAWYYVYPFAAWVVDCKYWHSSMGWMYRGRRSRASTTPVARPTATTRPGSWPPSSRVVCKWTTSTSSASRAAARPLDPERIPSGAGVLGTR